MSAEAANLALETAKRAVRMILRNVASDERTAAAALAQIYDVCSAEAMALGVSRTGIVDGLTRGLATAVFNTTPDDQTARAVIESALSLSRSHLGVLFTQPHTRTPYRKGEQGS